MAIERWTSEQTRRALYLYFQLPFGQIHSRNPEIIALAIELGRTPSSIAMKLANFASMDPKIRESGRKGLGGATALDRAVWQQFREDWTKSILEAEGILDAIGEASSVSKVSEPPHPYSSEPYQGPSVAQRLVEQRVGQNFFRRSVLANFDECCCVTGISDSRLLNASHIVPWGEDVANRHNPANGLCLSATFDRAFDRGLITILPTFRVQLAKCLTSDASEKTRAYFSPYAGAQIRAASRLDPDRRFLEWHNANRFVDAPMQ